MYGMYGDRFQQSIDQPGMVANPARGQLNRENVFFLSQFAYTTKKAILEK